MTGRIQKHPEVLARLDLRFAGPQRQDLPFAFVEIFDLEVDMRLLGTVGAGPHGGRWSRASWKAIVGPASLLSSTQSPISFATSHPVIAE